MTDQKDRVNAAFDRALRKAPSANKVSARDRRAADETVDDWSFIAAVNLRIDDLLLEPLRVRVAQALADARSDGYVAGVEDAARVARGKEVHTLGVFQYDGGLFADAILAALLGPKKEGGG